MAELAAANEEEAWSDEDWRAFPPLYTLQPHAATREAQLNVWIDLLWRWCKAQNSWTVDVASCDVFVNDAINRRLDEKGRREVAKAACRAGRGELLDNGALFMLEQQPKDLARQLYTVGQGDGQARRRVYAGGARGRRAASRAPTRGCGRRRWTRSRPRTGAPSSRARRRPRRVCLVRGARALDRCAGCVFACRAAVHRWRSRARWQAVACVQRRLRGPEVPQR